MAAPRGTAAERAREAREAAQRNTRRSLRLGTLGVVVLFLSGIGVLVLTDYVFVFVGGMAVGIVLLLAAFLLVRGSVLALTRSDETKIY